MNEESMLIGVWRSDPTDVAGLARFGDTTLDFRADGTLVHTLHEESKEHISLLTYRILGEVWIETDQPTRPRRERTRYRVSDRHLSLELGGETANYVRVE